MASGNDGRLSEIFFNRCFSKGDSNGAAFSIINCNIGKTGRIQPKGGTRKRVAIRAVQGFEPHHFLPGLKFQCAGNFRRGGFQIACQQYAFGFACLRGEGL